MKRQIPLDTATRLMNPGSVVLVSCQGPKYPNIITIAWQMPVSKEPPLVAISVGFQRYSHELIDRTGEYGVNVPTVELWKEVVQCGSVSGRDVDKYQTFNLSPLPASEISCPLIEECAGHLECRVTDRVASGDHTIFVAEVVCAQADGDLFDDHWNIDKAKLIHHLGGKLYTTPNTLMKFTD
jgi:flavin reductase (DIM6/NTAB) family NADH-FMN oxidoreductase RutF